MQIVFTPEAKKEFDFWVKSGNKSVLKKIGDLVKGIQENPFQGIGKPEQLKHNLTGKWSRRINLEHRIVYSIEGNNIILHSLKGHYD
jgi:toxin YoeB